MTRSSGYEFYACPKCGKLHRKKLFSSINLSVSPNFFERLATEIDCAGCGIHLQMKELYYIGKAFDSRVGYISLDNSRSMWQKIKDFFAGRVFKPIDSIDEEKPDWFDYPDITWKK